MRSEIADFVPVAATWRLPICAVIWIGNVTLSTRLEGHIILSSEEDCTECVVKFGRVF